LRGRNLPVATAVFAERIIYKLKSMAGNSPAARVA
jgi:hypothetical protein